MVLTQKIVDSSYAEVYLRVEDLPAHVRDRVHPIKKDLEMPDFAELMQRGWKWVFEAMQSAQPATFAELEKLSPQLEFRESLEGSEGEKVYWGDLLLNLNGKFLPVFPYSRGDSFEERSKKRQTDPFISSLPREIARAHYGRIAGLGWVDEVPYDEAVARIWPHRADFNLTLGNLIEDEGREDGPEFADALRKFSTNDQEDDEQILESFYVFLDTRKPGSNSNSGEVWLVEEDSKKPRLLLVNKMDSASIKVHQQAVEALDSYTSALLKRLQVS